MIQGNKHSGWRWLWSAALLLSLDRLTKWWVLASLSYGQSVQVLPVLSWVRVHNHGAAFGFLHDASGWQRWFFVVLALGVALAVLFALRRMPARPVLLPLAWSMILGGALGNVWDRLQYGHVIDFIDVHWRHWHWPAFNVADIAICVGALLLLIAQCRQS